MKFSVLDRDNPEKGIYLYYYSDELCDNRKDYMGIRIENYCDLNANEPVTYEMKVYSPYDCTAVVKVRTKYGCPIGKFGFYSKKNLILNS